MNKNIFIYILMLFSMLSFVSATTYYEHQFNYSNMVTNNLVHLGTINTGWDTINSSSFYNLGTTSNINRGASITFSQTLNGTLNASWNNINTGNRHTQLNFVTDSSQGSNDGYSIYLSEQTPGTLLVYRYDDGAANLILNTVTSTSSTNGEWDFIIENGFVLGYMDETLEFNLSDSTYTDFGFFDVSAQVYQFASHFYKIENLIITDNQAPPSPTPLITIDDISLVNNSNVSSNFNVSLNISQTNSNNNINTSYTLSETFDNPTYSSTNISYSSITPFITDTGTTRNQFCIENGFDSASSYTFTSDSNPAKYYTGAIWSDTTINANIYTSITCEETAQFGTNNLSPSTEINISGLSDGTKNIYFYSFNNETNATSSNFTFNIDTINPNVTIITNETEFNSFSINMSNIFNVTDLTSGLESCLINITELETNVTINDTTQANCTDTVNFSTAGLHELQVIATDYAGNVNDSVFYNITINPFIYIFFNDTFNSSIVLSYDAIIFHPDNRTTTPTINTDGSIQLSAVNDGDLDLGIHTIEFSKLGFALENFTVNVNDTDVFNETFNVTRSKIIVNVFDRETESLVTGTTTITLIDTIGFNTTTTTGQVNISNILFVVGDYQLIADNPSYATESVYFNYDTQENLNVDVYMLSNSSTDSGTITIQAIATTGQLIQGAICKALEWKPAESAFVAVAQGTTNINGETLLNIEIGSKLYKFSCTKGDTTAISEQQIIQVDASTLPVIMEDAGLITSAILNNLEFTFINNTFNSTHENFIFDYNDKDGLVNEACVTWYQIEGTKRTELGSNCVSSSQSTINSDIISINNTYDLKVIASVTVGSVIVEVDSISYKSNTSLQTFLAKYNFDILIPIVFVFVGVLLGLILKPQNIYISEIAVIILVWLSVAIVPSVISASIAVFVTVITVLMMVGGFRRK